jgi:Na+-translocating ferredoxin:NAD+ oxidoreductase RnfD subunit
MNANRGEPPVTVAPKSATSARDADAAGAPPNPGRGASGRDGTAQAQASSARSGFRVEAPTPRDPRVTLALALTTWTVFGQTFLYFNRDLRQIGLALAVGCGLDVVIFLWRDRKLVVPISAYITCLSIGILLASADTRVFAVAAAWGVLSKHLLRAGDRHFFNPSNFAIVTAVALLHGVATVAPGSQWGGDYRVAALVIALGLMMMKRVGRLDLVLAWMGGYVFMSLLRVALGQGGLVFALGPMTGAEFMLFTFSMIPDPKTNPPTRDMRIAWGLAIAVVDGVLRFLEIRYSMFYALFGLCATLPLIRAIARARGIEEKDPWKTAVLVLSGRGATANPAAPAERAPVAGIPAVALAPAGENAVAAIEESPAEST